MKAKLVLYDGRAVDVNVKGDFLKRTGILDQKCCFCKYAFTRLKSKNWVFCENTMLAVDPNGFCDLWKGYLEDDE